MKLEPEDMDPEDMEEIKQLLEENKYWREKGEYYRKKAKQWKMLAELFQEEIEKAKKRYNIPEDSELLRKK